MMAGATLATVPVLVVFLAASGRFVSGLTAGSVKS
jgi:ABC-type glycerol-3-phosphate transport system permease component